MTDIEKTKPLEGEVVDNRALETPAAVPAISPLNQPLSATKTGRRGNVFIGTLNLIMTPAKTLAKPLHHHYHRKYRAKYKHAKKLFVLDLILLGLAAALLVAGLYFFFSQPSQNYLDIQLKPSGPTIAGQTRDFIFQLTNKTDRPLTDLHLKFEFPRSFVLKDSPPGFNPAANTFFLELLKEKQAREFAFHGQAWGNINETEKIVIQAQFKEGKNNAALEQITATAFSFTDPALKVDWTLPTKIFIGQNLTLSVNYRNVGDEQIAKAIVLPTLPDDFEIISSHPALKGGRWILENLEARAAGQINLTGYLRSLPRAGHATLTLQTFLENNDQTFRQNSLLDYLSIQDHGLNLKTQLTSDRIYLKIGEESSLRVTYLNQGEWTIKNFSITLPLPAGLAEAQEASYKKTAIAPGESGSFELNFRLRSPPVALEKNPTLTLRPLAVFSFQDQPEETLRALTAPLTLKISSASRFLAEARYFTAEGDQLGRGPLPPKVGQTTKYWLNWSVLAWPNDLKKTTLSGRLPAGVNWTGKTNVAEGEPIKYDPATRIVAWSSERLATAPSNQCPCPSVGFEVAVTPTSADSGQTPNLLTEQTLRAIDAFTNEELFQTIPDLTTDLINDPLAKGKGTVQP